MVVLWCGPPLKFGFCLNAASTPCQSPCCSLWASNSFDKRNYDRSEFTRHNARTDPQSQYSSTQTCRDYLQYLAEGVVDLAKALSFFYALPEFARRDKQAANISAKVVLHVACGWT